MIQLCLWKSAVGCGVSWALALILLSWAAAGHPAVTPITLKVSQLKAVKFDRPVTVQILIRSSLDAPGTLVELIFPKGVSCDPQGQQLDLTANQPLRLTSKCIFSPNTPKGNLELQVRALNPRGEDEVWGDLKSLLFHKTRTGIVPGWDISMVPVGNWQGDGDTPPEAFDPTPWTFKQDLRFKPEIKGMPIRQFGNQVFTATNKGTPSKTLQGKGPHIIPMSPGPVTLRGRWLYHDRSAVEQAIDQQVIEIRRGDGSRIGSGLFPCFTDAGGFFNCTFSHPGTSLRVWIRSWTNFCNNGPCTDSDWLGVFSGNELSCGSDSIFCSYPVQTGVISCPDGGNCDVGTWVVHTTAPGEPWVGAHQLSQDLVRSNKKSWFDLRHPGEPTSAGDGRVNYPAPAGHGTHAHVRASGNNSIPDGWISIEANQRSGDTMTHEYGHVVMANWYGAGASLPTDDCPSSHAIEAVSGTGCAWQEGWANFWSAYSDEFYDGDNNAANDGPIWNWFSGASRNLETRGGNTFANGERVEGNVAGALWDIFDVNNENAPFDGVDQITNALQHIWHTTHDNNNSNFSSWWDSFRAGAGHPACNGKLALWNNTINYAQPADCNVIGTGLPPVGFEPANITAVEAAPNPATRYVEFVVEGTGIAHMQLEVFDVAGRRVVNSGSNSGKALRWYLRNDRGLQLADGVYLYVVTLRGLNGAITRGQVKKLVISR